MKENSKLNRHPSEIDEYKKDFEAAEEQQPLYVKQDQKDDSQVNKKSSTKKKTKAFKPEKKILAEIKQLLTYRMKGQRYTFGELKKDI